MGVIVQDWQSESEEGPPMLQARIVSLLLDHPGKQLARCEGRRLLHDKVHDGSDADGDGHAGEEAHRQSNGCGGADVLRGVQMEEAAET